MANKVKDIEIITGTPAKLAVRLCNFVTKGDFLLYSHQNWLDTNMQPIVRSLTNCWIDINGFASKRGNADYNYRLSKRRCESVKEWISNYSDKIDFHVPNARGETQSGTDESNDDGNWRAVEIYVYGFRPPGPRPQRPVNRVMRIVKRQFIQTDTTNVHNEKEPLADAVDLLLNLSGLKSMDNDESKGLRQVSEFPQSYQVNKVTQNTKVTVSAVSTSTVTVTETTILYVWGIPEPNVTIIKNYQPTIFGDARPLTTRNKTVARASATDLYPPNP